LVLDFFPNHAFIFLVLIKLVILNGEKMNVVEMVGNFLSDAKRIFFVSKKPTMEEYKRMALIVALGIIAVGIIGYIIYLFFALTGIGY
jgi:protein translocase SEC61 complex gamma subunit